MNKVSHWKKAGCLMLSLLLLMGMAACGSQTDNDNSTAGDSSGEKEQITIKAMLQYTSDSQKEAQDYATEKMKEVMPEVTMELEMLPEDGDVTTKTLAASGNLPDIVKTNAGIIELFLKSQNIIELDKYVDETGIKDRINPGDQGMLYHEDGHCYAIPYASQESYLIFYNKKVFADNNVEVPTKYSEFLDAIKTFNNNGVIPLALFAKDVWPAVTVLDSIVSREDPKGLTVIDTGKAKMSDDLYVRSAEKLKELVDAGLISKSAFSAANEEAMASFANNQAAMYANGCWAIKDLTASMGDDGFGYLNYPLQDADASDANTNARVGGQGIGGISVASNCKNPDVAAKFACLLAMELGNGRYVAGESLSPFTIDEGIEPKEDFGAVAKQYSEDSTRFASYTLFPWNFKHNDTMNILSEEVSKLMTGDYTVDEFIQSSDKRMAEMLAEDE